MNGYLLRNYSLFMNNQANRLPLRQAGVSYVAAGLFLLINGFPYWFGHRRLDQDPLLKAHQVVGIFHQIDNFKETIIQLWAMVVATLALVVAHYSLWRSGQPTGDRKRYLFLIPLAGSLCHLLCFEFPLPFAPMGTLLTSLGMLWVGAVSIRSRIWSGWHRFTPLFVGLFTFMVQLPLYLILGTPPYHVLPLWGLPIGLLGIASWRQAKALSSNALAYRDETR